MADAESTSVKVAVRVRPFAPREIERGTKCIIRMQDKTTIITDPADGSDKQFTFDYSYWSFDEHDPHFASQQTVFNDLGLQVIQNAWEGYNCSIFAYGQTGSGKSYSMLGYGDDSGIIPRLCAALFDKINNSDDPQKLFKIEVSFMEIYNETVKDLLNPANKGKLKVRNHPKIGPYVEDLSKIAVKGFTEIEALMDEGTKARTVASTNMNATSSRSHALFTIEFTTAKFIDNDNASETVSKINLVDLAGSERVASTGTTGVRLKEGANINKSLSTLGKVISALALNSVNPKKQVHVPYRDSVLTWLLKESLGGNSKTVMIATLSPADINYGETLSTLRYADNAKQIKNKAVVNEDPTARLIRDLKTEVEALRKQLGIPLPGELGSVASGPQGVALQTSIIAKEEQVNKLKEELESREKLIAEMNKTWEERLKEAQALKEERKAALQDMGVAVKVVAALPYLVMLNEDPLMSETLLYYLPEGVTRIGRSDAEPDIVLNGLSIHKEHCIIQNTSNMVTITPFVISSDNNELQVTPIYVNGNKITDTTRLYQGNRVILGTNHVFRFNNPEEAKQHKVEKDKKETAQRIDWDFAIREFAEKQGKLALNQAERPSRKLSIALSDDEYEEPESSRRNSVSSKSDRKRRKLEDKVMQVTLSVNEANAIADALQAPLKFDLKLSVASRDYNKTEVAVRVLNTEAEQSSVWSYETFMTRFDELRDVYQNVLLTGQTQDVDVTALFEPDSTEQREQLIGVSYIYLKDLLYLFDVNRKQAVLDFQGDEIGYLQVHLSPKLTSMEEPQITHTDVDTDFPPKVHLGSTLQVTIKISKLTNLTVASQFYDIYCKFYFYDNQMPYQTQIWEGIGNNTEISFDFENSVTLENISHQVLTYLESTSFAVEIWGQHSLDTSLPQSNQLTTHALNDTEKESLQNVPEPHSYDLYASVNIYEHEKDDQSYFPVPIKEIQLPTASFATTDVNTSAEATQNRATVFLIRLGHEPRKIVFNLFQYLTSNTMESSSSQHPSSFAGIESVFSAILSNLKLKKTKNATRRKSLTPQRAKSMRNLLTPNKDNSIQSAPNTPTSREWHGNHGHLENSRTLSISVNGERTPISTPTKDAPPSLANFRMDLEVQSVDHNKITVLWNPQSNANIPTILSEETSQGFIISAVLELTILLKSLPKPISISAPIHFKIVQSSRTFKQSATILEQYKNLLLEKTSTLQNGNLTGSSGEDVGGSLLSLRVTKSNNAVIDTNRNANTSIIALLDEHQQNVKKLTNVIETERMKQCQELSQKLHGNNSTLAPPEKSRRNSFDVSSLTIAEMDGLENPNGSSWNSADTARVRGQSDASSKSFHLKHSRHNSWDFSGENSDSHTARVKTVALEVNPASLHRAVDMSGWLFKKGTTSDSWKKVWAIFRKPFLFYYHNDGENLLSASNEKSIDLSNCAVTQVTEEQKPNCFAVLTWKRVFILQATNEIELNKWMKILDPNFHSHEKNQLQSKIQTLQVQLSHKDSQIDSLHSRLGSYDQEYNRETEQYKTDLLRLQTTLALLQAQLSHDKQKEQQREKLVRDMQQENALLKQKLEEFAQKELARKDMETDTRELEQQTYNETRNHAETQTDFLLSEMPEIAQLKSELDNLKLTMQQKEYVIHNQSTQLEKYTMEMQEVREELSAKDRVIELWESSNDELKQKLGYQSEQMEILLEKYSQVSQELRESRSRSNSNNNSKIPNDDLEQEVKLLEAEIVEKEYQCDVLAGQIKSMEEELKLSVTTIEQLNAKIKLQQDELDACNELISDKFSVKVPMESSWNPFSSTSRIEFLEKQYIVTKKASLAHQTHNAYLNMEITRLEKELQAQLEMRQQTIDRLKKEIALLRRKQFTTQKGASQMGTASITVDDTFIEQFELLKKKYFESYALGVKMNLVGQGLTCHANFEEMYDQAMVQGITNPDDFPDWIVEKLNQMAVPLHDMQD